PAFACIVTSSPRGSALAIVPAPRFPPSASAANTMQPAPSATSTIVTPRGAPPPASVSWICSRFLTMPCSLMVLTLPLVWLRRLRVVLVPGDCRQIHAVGGRDPDRRECRWVARPRRARAERPGSGPPRSRDDGGRL